MKPAFKIMDPIPARNPFLKCPVVQIEGPLRFCRVPSFQTCKIQGFGKRKPEGESPLAKHLQKLGRGSKEASSVGVNFPSRRLKHFPSSSQRLPTSKLKTIL